MKLFEQQTWERTKSMLLQGDDLVKNQDGSVNKNKKNMMNVLLENTRAYMTSPRMQLLESATAGATQSGNIATLNKVILPVIRRVMPTVIANELVGVQPMTAPVAQIHTLRVLYANNAAGVTAGTEALGPYNLARAYTGNEDSVNPGAAPTTVLEGRPGNAISIQTLRQVVEAQSRKISARWTFEAAQDASSQQGIDIETEMMSILAQEITTQIDQEILTSLRNLAAAGTDTYDQTALTGTPHFVGDQHAALAILINKKANEIGQRVRRGAGNWVVVSPTVLTLLQSAGTSVFARTTEGVFEAPTNTKFVGTLNSYMKVFVDGYADVSAPVLVGFKGATETEAPAFYCPYIPLTSSGVVLDPTTMEPVVSFMTRYGYAELKNVATSLGNASDYLGRIEIDPAKLKFQ
jgi:hypothetical protein